MMHPFAEMAGLEVNKDNQIVPTYLTTKIPEPLVTIPFASLSKAERDKRDKFYQRLAKLVKRPEVKVWEDRKYALPSVAWVSAVMTALQPELDLQEAGALANYAGGAVRYNGTFGISDAEPGSDDFLDVDNLLSAGTSQLIHISNALGKLKKVNPGAHEYIVSLIAAKAARQKAQVDIQLAQDTKKVIQQEIAIAQKALQVPVDLAKGALDTAQTAGKVFKYMPWVIGGTVVLLAWIVYKNRETVGSVAKLALTKRLGA
jgi:hypothetical protein